MLIFRLTQARDSMDITEQASETNKTYQKCDRVRSWYMYEQMRSLERDQHDAARRLKSKTSLDRLLRRERISESRVKRKLSDQFSSCQSELQRKSELATTISSLDNFYADLCEQETKSFYINDSRESMTSNEFNGVTGDYDCNFLKITKKINEHAQNTEMNDIEHMEFCDGEIYEQESIGSCDLPIETSEPKLPSKYGFNTEAIMSTWSKLVIYAHQIMKLHHGANCYVEYSSQFLTAVLVLDVLRMVFGGLCDILQPLVCPISFNCSNDLLFQTMKKHKHEIRKNRLVKFIHCKEVENRNIYYDFENRQNEQKLKHRDVYKSQCKCRCLRRVIHGLLKHLKLSRLIDDMLDNISN